MHEPIRAVLLDAVGTVIQPRPDVIEVYTAAGKRHGSHCDTRTIRTRFHDAVAKHFHDKGTTNERHEYARWRQIVADVFDDVPDRFELIFRELWDHFADPRHWSLYDDVLPAWKLWRARNLVIGIASNFDARLFNICRAWEPLNDADHLFCSSRIGYSKPRAEFFAHIEQQLGIPGNQLLMVGDNFTNDVEAARAAGWQAAWIQRDEGASIDDRTVRQLSQLAARLK